MQKSKGGGNFDDLAVHVASKPPEIVWLEKVRLFGVTLEPITWSDLNGVTLTLIL